MNELAEAIAVFVPDFVALAVSASAFFGLCCWAAALGLFETKGLESGLLFSLIFGYAVTVALNLVSSFVSPSAPRVSSLPRLKSGARQPVLEPLARQCALKAGRSHWSGRDPDTRLELQPICARCSEENPAAPDASPRHSV